MYVNHDNDHKQKLRKNLNKYVGFYLQLYLLGPVLFLLPYTYSDIHDIVHKQKGLK